MASFLGTANHSAFAHHGPAASPLHLPSSLRPTPLAPGQGLFAICLVCPAPSPCGDSAPLGLNAAPALSASSEVQHLTQASWREEQCLWASPVDLPKVFVARCVRTSIWGICFPLSSSEDVCEPPRVSSECRAAGSPSGCTARPSQGMHSAGSSPGLGDALPLWDAAAPKLCTPVTRIVLVHAWLQAQGLAGRDAAQMPAVATAVLWTSFFPGHAWSFRWATFFWHFRGSSVCVTQGLMAINCAAKAIFWFQFNFAFTCG